MGVEYELKYRATEAAQDALFRQLSPYWHTVRMETTYYDTADFALSARRYTLRRRLENGRSVCTLKTPAAGQGRGEWETECGSIEEAIEELCKLGAPTHLILMTAPGLREVCSARFTRQAVTLDLEHAKVEVALDRGWLFSGENRQALCEVEVELKSGSQKAADEYAATLALEFGLTPEPHSKFRRALSLMRGV